MKRKEDVVLEAGQPVRDEGLKREVPVMFSFMTNLYVHPKIPDRALYITNVPWTNWFWRIK